MWAAAALLYLLVPPLLAGARDPGAARASVQAAPGAPHATALTARASRDSHRA
ncbi:exported hypothetical protein [Burkholderia latens]